MKISDLTPGTVTTLGKLRPGDVGEFANNPDGGKFVVTAVQLDQNRIWILYQHDIRPHVRYSDQYQVRFLGRGRIEPARIVMEGETDRVAELEEQVRTLREELAFYADPDTYHAIGFIPDSPCGAFSDDFDTDHDDAPRWRPGKRARAALAATTPKETP